MMIDGRRPNISRGSPRDTPHRPLHERFSYTYKVYAFDDLPGASLGAFDF